jgi:two-component system sensor histidine kinase KdpD
MVRNLLAITRVEAGALELSRDWIDVREVLNRPVAKARRRGAGQAFETATDPELPCISADPNLLDQALENLVGNATRLCRSARTDRARGTHGKGQDYFVGNG